VTVTPQISFAVPYYQGQDFLLKTLRSVQAQTNPNWEVVVVDDAGPDDASQVVAALNDLRISYIRKQENVGLAGNWNRSLAATTSPYVTILHADDVLLPNYAEMMLQLLDTHPQVAASHCGVEIIDERGEPKRTVVDVVKKAIMPKGSSDIISSGQHGAVRLMRGSWIYCPTICYRRDCFPESGFDGNWRFVVDLDLLVRLMLTGHSLVGRSEVGLQYRRHDEAQTSILTKSLVRFEEELTYYERVSLMAHQQGWRRLEVVARRATMVRLHAVYHGLTLLVHCDLRGAWRALVLGIKGTKNGTRL
jgi:glycosyltransferase involved in cell wall biosynthesis